MRGDYKSEQSYRNPSNGEVDMSYAHEKLHTCISHLVGSGTVQQRLAEAFSHNLAVLQVSQLPKDLRPEFASIQDAVTRVPQVAEEGTINATVYQLSDDQASEICKRIFALYAAIAERER